MGRVGWWMRYWVLERRHVRDWRGGGVKRQVVGESGMQRKTELVGVGVGGLFTDHADICNSCALRTQIFIFNFCELQSS